MNVLSICNFLIIIGLTGAAFGTAFELTEFKTSYRQALINNKQDIKRLEHFLNEKEKIRFGCQDLSDRFLDGIKVEVDLDSLLYGHCHIGPYVGTSGEILYELINDNTINTKGENYERSLRKSKNQ